MSEKEEEAFDFLSLGKVAGLDSLLHAARATVTVAQEIMNQSKDTPGSEKWHVLLQNKNATIHALKTWPQYFSEIQAGTKTFEYRLNDRNFQEGDYVLLCEWDPDTKGFTGRQSVHRIGFLLSDDYGHGKDLGKYVIFSLLPVE